MRLKVNLVSHALVQLLLHGGHLWAVINMQQWDRGLPNQEKAVWWKVYQPGVRQVSSVTSSKNVKLSSISLLYSKMVSVMCNIQEEAV